MPWRVSGVVDQRMRFVQEYGHAVTTMAELCRAYGIARKTGYKWVERFMEQGRKGLEDLSRAPERHPNQTGREVEEEILALRGRHMRWGPRKLRWYLQDRQPRRAWPAASSIGELLKREGLVVERRARPKTPP